VNDPKKTDYHHGIMFPAFTDEAASMSIFDLLPMALPLPLNHGLPIGYIISGKITGENMIEAWNVFTVAEETHTDGSTLLFSTDGQKS
jgi:hypothetical protein